MATTATAAQIPWGLSLPQWQSWYGKNVGNQVMVNGQLRTIGTQDLSPEEALSAYRSQTMGWNVPPAAPTYFGPGATAPPPETQALSQMAQIDPASEALRQQLSTSYATPLAQATGAPNPAMLQSYLQAYQQLDPATYAAMQALPGQYRQYLGGLNQALGTAQGQMALGSTLDPTTQIQVEQAARAAQGARGNIYGVAPAVEEAMTQGQAGQALQQQRYGNLLSALSGYGGGLGQTASYLAGGATPGATALNLYQQQLGNLRQAQAGTTSYLGSGQTPYQAGAGYLANAQNMANQAAAGGPVYQPTGISQTPTPYSYLNPTYGLSMGQQANQMYNSMLQSYGMQQAGQSGGGGMGALAGGLGGAASGAMSGAMLGSVVPGVGTAVGAVAGGLLGGLGGGAKGYFG